MSKRTKSTSLWYPPVHAAFLSSEAKRLDMSRADFIRGIIGKHIGKDIAMTERWVAFKENYTAEPKRARLAEMSNRWLKENGSSEAPTVQP